MRTTVTHRSELTLLKALNRELPDNPVVKGHPSPDQPEAIFIWQEVEPNIDREWLNQWLDSMCEIRDKVKIRK